MIHKQILLPNRVRRPPRDGWSWIDRRFVREFAPRLSHEAILLYFFLAAVSDKDGLSFYREATIAVRLRISEADVVAARDELVAMDLVAYRAPLVQCSVAAGVSSRHGGLVQFGELCGRWPRRHPSRSTEVTLKDLLMRFAGCTRWSGCPRLIAGVCTTTGWPRRSRWSRPPRAPGRMKYLDPYRGQIDAVAEVLDLSAVRVTEKPEDGHAARLSGAAVSCRVRPTRGGVYQRCTTNRARPCRSIGETADAWRSANRAAGLIVRGVLCYNWLCYIEFSLRSEADLPGWSCPTGSSEVRGN
jgi:hypothetical protein